jgi:hypothetical protein
MEEQQYREAVAELINKKLDANHRLINFALGLCGETSELKELAINNKLSDSEVIFENGDVGWYLTAFSIDLNLSERELSVFHNAYLRTATVEDYIDVLQLLSGKIADLVKKVTIHKHPIENKLAELTLHLQDFRKYYYHMLYRMGFTIEEVRQANIDKLFQRYPEKTFSSERSVNRVDK